MRHSTQPSNLRKYAHIIHSGLTLINLRLSEFAHFTKGGISLHRQAIEWSLFFRRPSRGPSQVPAPFIQIKIEYLTVLLAPHIKFIAGFSQGVQLLVPSLWTNINPRVSCVCEAFVEVSIVCCRLACSCEVTPGNASAFSGMTDLRIFPHLN